MQTSKLSKDVCASKAHGIAQALGVTWHVAKVNEGWNVWITLRNELDPDLGINLSFSEDMRGKQTIDVTGEYIKGWHDTYERNVPKIGCSADRPPGSIAGDIARRFLPDYLAIIEKEQAKRAHWNEVDRHKGMLLDDLFCPVGMVPAEDGKVEFGRKHDKPGWWYEISVYDWQRSIADDVFTASLDTMRVKIEVVLSARRAQEIMRLLKEWQDENV